MRTTRDGRKQLLCSTQWRWMILKRALKTKCVKMCLHWIILPQDRVPWRSHMNMLINFYIPQN